MTRALGPEILFINLPALIIRVLNSSHVSSHPQQKCFAQNSRMSRDLQMCSAGGSIRFHFVWENGTDKTDRTDGLAASCSSLRGTQRQ
jgi:hypothetical protein